MTDTPRNEKQKPVAVDSAGPAPAPGKVDMPETEVGGRDGPEPTRYGDWEVGGICTDF